MAALREYIQVARSATGQSRDQTRRSQAAMSALRSSPSPPAWHALAAPLGRQGIAGHPRAEFMSLHGQFEGTVVRPRLHSPVGSGCSLHSGRRPMHARCYSHAYDGLSNRLYAYCPRPSQAIRGAISRYLRSIAFSQVDIVPAIEELVAADRIDREAIGAVAANDRLLLQIDSHVAPRIGSDRGRKLRGVMFRHHRGKQSVLDGILRKDVAE